MDRIRENLERHMTELRLRIGSRHTGSVGERAAADYIERVFREYGFDPRRRNIPQSDGNLKISNSST